MQGIEEHINGQSTKSILQETLKQTTLFLQQRNFRQKEEEGEARVYLI